MRVEDLDFNDFEDVLNTISGVEAWEWDASFSQGDIQAIARRAESTESECRFSHQDTGGALYVRLPDLSETQGCMIGLLEQPFDPQNPRESTFLREVGKETGRLVPANVEYITPEYTAINVLKINVPVRYEISKVEAAVYTASTVSADVAELYQDIRDSLGPSGH